jgi:hypothetical protein
MEWAWDENHSVQGPLLARARAIAFEHGMSQDAFSRMLSLHVAHQVQEQQLIARAKEAELGKLGEMAPVRIDAVKTWVHALVGDAAPQLLRVIEQAPMASTIVGFERMMRAYVSQGVGGSPGAHRDGAGAGPERLSDEAYGKLSYSEKQAYAQKFDQSKFQGRGP